AILYEILSLKRPFTGKTPQEILVKVVEGDLKFPEIVAPERNIPKELSAVVMKAMSSNQRRRYQSVGELRRDIDLFLEGRAVSAREDSFVESLFKLVRRNQAASVSALIGFILILLLSGLFVHRLKEQRDVAESHRRDAVAALGTAEKAQSERDRTALQASRDMAEQAVRSADMGLIREARIRAGASQKLAPRHPWGDYGFGYAAWKGKQLDEAVKHLSAALQKDKNHRPSINTLAQVKTQQGKIDDAAKMVENIDNLKDWRSALSAGETLYTAKSWRKAQAALRKALDLMKASWDADQNVKGRATGKLKRASAWVQCEGFHESIKNLSAEEKIKRVHAKLREVNGRKGIDIDKVIQDGVLRWLRVRDAMFLQPLHGLKLNSLHILSPRAMEDLSPLQGMPLVHFEISGAGIKDLSPLKGMMLKSLKVYDGSVRSLAPLKGMPLEQVLFTGTGNYTFTDLSPLKGMPLKKLEISHTHVKDLSPLQGLPLEELSAFDTKVTDIEGLRGLPLKKLNLSYCRIKSLKPLSECKHLVELRIVVCRLRDLSGLEGLPLKWLHAPSNEMRDIQPLAGLPLEVVNLSYSPLTDLSPLKTCTKLRQLVLHRTKITDLSPLAGKQIKELSVSYSRITDLSPLANMPLEKLRFTGCAIKDFSVLKTLKQINGLASPAIFWLLGKIDDKEFEARTKNGGAHVFYARRFLDTEQWVEAEKYVSTNFKKYRGEIEYDWARWTLEWLRKEKLKRKYFLNLIEKW
ncbi:MAG: hypothetical protein QF886_12665, partial [Planctomycetota bacterium]|nr:hypothetical protein [Planctomycetota bacterium]